MVVVEVVGCNVGEIEFLLIIKFFLVIDVVILF